MTERRQTRGFLFADLRDYSRFTERHGDDAAAQLLARYRLTVRDVIGRFDGAEIRTEGDSFYVVFSSVGSAVQAGLAILENADKASSEPADEPIRVGIGIHAGETTDGEQGIVSSAVNIAARVCSVAGPGELLVTDTVRYLVRGYLHVGFTGVGSRRLKGISEPVSLYRVGPSTADAPRRTIRSSIPRGWLRRGAIAGAAAVVVATIATIGGTLVLEGVVRQDQRPSATESGSGGTSGIVPGSTLQASPSGAGSQAFPTEAEAALLALLDDSVARHCVRADPVDVPTFTDNPTVIPLAHDAGLECSLGMSSQPDTVWYWRGVPGQRFDHVRSIFFQAVGRGSIPPADCASTDPAYGPWEFGATRGNLLCYGSDDATLLWTYESENVLATAVRSDGDMRTLYRWWRDHARLLGG